MFDEEFLFVEDSAEHWLPVQNVLIPHFKEEMRAGESVDLFAVWIGITFAEPGKRQHVFLVNEFEKPQQTKSTKSKASSDFRRRDRFVGQERRPLFHATAKAFQSAGALNFSFRNHGYLCANDFSRPSSRALFTSRNVQVIEDVRTRGGLGM